MSVSRWTYVHCDGFADEGFWCGATVDGKRAPDARRKGREQGWQRIDGRDICAVCLYDQQKERERREEAAR